MVLIIENDAEVPPGTLQSLLVETGRSFRIVRVHKGEPAGNISEASGLVVLGGAMSTSDQQRFPFLQGVKRLMISAMEGEIPLLGICLGGQLLAEVSGGMVESNSQGERGVHDVVLTAEGVEDPLFAGLPERFTVFQWHNDSFTPPPSAARLAASPVCAHQAFRVGRNAYGLQFHPEVNQPIVSAWATGSNAASRIIRAFAAYGGKGLDSAPHRLLENFIGMIP